MQEGQVGWDAWEERRFWAWRRSTCVVKVLSKEEHKRKLEEDAKLATLAGKLSKEIPEEVILESLKMFSVEEK